MRRSASRPTWRRRGEFRAAGAASYRGRKAEWHVAEVAVTLREAARHRVASRRKAVPGRPLALRRVATEVRDATGAVQGGRSEVRRVLDTAALSARVRNPALKVFADRLVAAGKADNVVIIAVARKLVVIANAILRDNRPWQPEMA